MIARRVAEGAYVKVVCFVVGGLTYRHSGASPSAQARTLELVAACGVLGVHDVDVLYNDLNCRLDTLPQLELIKKLDAILDAGNFDEVYFPYAGHHQDHRAVHDAAYAALRLTAGRRVPPLAALYEYTFIGWTPREVAGGRYYINISDNLEDKLAAMRCYDTQFRPGDQPISGEALTALARIRGVEAGVPFAELFYIQRLID